MKEAKCLSFLFSLFFSLAYMFSVYSLHPAADSMWIDPSTLGFYTNTTSVGYKFNVTLWLNVTTPINSWQFYLIYNKNHLNVTRCDYTGNYKSMWSEDALTKSVTPGFDEHNSTHNYVLHGEVLKNSAEKTGFGSLSWVEFEINQAPNQSQNLTGKLSLDIAGIFNSYALDKDYAPITLEFGNADYTFEYVAPRYFLEVKTEPQGVVVISGEGWYEEYTSVELLAPDFVTVSTGTRHKFTYWDVNGGPQGLGVNPIIVIMDANYTATAHYILQYYLTVNSPYGTPGGAGWYTVGSTAYSTLNIGFLDHENGSRRIFTNWGGAASGTNYAQSNPIIMNGPKTAVAYWKTQYYLTLDVNPLGIVLISGEGWYDKSSGVSLTAPLVVDYGFLYWDVDGVSQGDGVNPIIVNMDAPHTGIAHYSAATIHDVAVTNVTVFRTVAGQGFPLAIYVTVENQGDGTEVFNVTAYSNSTVIQTKIVTLANSGSTTVVFSWDTTGLEEYKKHVIRAYAHPVSNETDISDNNFIDGVVTVAHVGDINADGKIDIMDVAVVSGAFGTVLINEPEDLRYGEYWHPSPCPYCPHNPNADINDDGKIDIQDLARTSMNFGWHL